jgi:hypothetical protein
MNLENLEKLIYWINERQKIYDLRASGKKAPWTEDKILRNFHFCNVHREDDRGTKEIHAVRMQMDVPLHQLPAFYTMARLFNKASTAMLYAQGGTGPVRANRDRGGVNFHTAYVVSTCGVSMDKLDYVDRVIGDVEKSIIRQDDCKTAFADLRKVPGLGSFLSGQIVADLKYTDYLREADDWWVFAVMGPGSKKGMDHLIGGTNETNFLGRLNDLHNTLFGQVPEMHNQDLQNCLCEFSKYMRYLNDSRGRRRIYNANY